MVKEYAERLYEPAAAAHTILAAENGKRATELSTWKNKIRKDWPKIRITDVKALHGDRNVFVGDALEVSANVHLGSIQPEFVTVQAYVGEAANNEIQKPATIELKKVKKVDESNYVYSGAIPARESGSYGLNVRVIPMHPNLTQAHELRMITWAH
jgi:starch phosphorylase